MFWLHLCVLLTKHGRAACHLAVTLPPNLTHCPFRWVVLNSTHHLLSGGHYCLGPLWHEDDPKDSCFLLMPQRGHVTGMQGQPLGSLDVAWSGVLPGQGRCAGLWKVCRCCLSLHAGNERVIVLYFQGRLVPHLRI